MEGSRLPSYRSDAAACLNSVVLCAEATVPPTAGEMPWTYSFDSLGVGHRSLRRVAAAVRSARKNAALSLSGRASEIAEAAARRNFMGLSGQGSPRSPSRSNERLSRPRKFRELTTTYLDRGAAFVRGHPLRGGAVGHGATPSRRRIRTRYTDRPTISGRLFLGMFSRYQRGDAVFVSAMCPTKW